MWVVPLRFRPGDDLRLAGTLSADGAHLHIALADSAGAVVGGHLCSGSLVRTTAELVVGLLPDWQFSREIDPATGWAELQIRPAPDGVADAIAGGLIESYDPAHSVLERD